ncbi:MAG: contractile injection system tape measure protein [Bacteroidota bacterium]
MSEKQQHSIRQTKLEVNFDNRYLANELQSRLSHLFRDKLAKLIEEVLDETTDPLQLIKIDSLEVELGVVPYEKFEQHIIDRLAPALRKALSDSIAKLRVYPTGQDREVNISNTSVELLGHFLQHGSLPWWGKNKQIDLNALLKECLQDNTAALIELVRKIGKQEQVRKRLVLQFKEPALKQLVAKLEPQEQSFILDYVKEIKHVQQEKKLVKTTSLGFQNSIWEFVLAFLLVDRGSVFNTKSFIKYNVLKMAEAYKIDYSQLLSMLASAVDQLVTQFSFKTSLPSIISSLYEEDDTASKDAIQTSDGSDNTISEQERIGKTVWHFLQYGSLPIHATILTEADFQTIFLAFLEQLDEEDKSYFVTRGKQAFIRGRLIDILSDEVMSSIPKVLEPAHAPLINAYAKHLLITYEPSTLGTISRSTFRHQLWEVILSYLFINRGSHFNTKSFLSVTLSRIASSFQITFKELLALLIETLPSIKGHSQYKASLPGLIRELKEESGVFEEKEKQLIDSEFVVPEAWEELEQEEYQQLFLDVFSYFLAKGEIPWWAQKHYDLQKLTKALAVLTAQSPSHVNHAIRKRIVTRADIERVSGFKEKVIDIMIQALVPQERHLVNHYAKSLHQNETLTQSAGRYGSDYKKAIWQTVFFYILEDRGSRFNTKSFIKSTLKALATAYGLDYRQLVSSTIDIAYKRTDNQGLAFLKILEEIDSEEFEPILIGQGNLDESTDTVSQNQLEKQEAYIQLLLEVLKIYLSSFELGEKALSLGIETEEQLISRLHLLDSNQLIAILASRFASEGATSDMPERLSHTFLLRLFVVSSAGHFIYVREMLEIFFSLARKSELSSQEIDTIERHLLVAALRFLSSSPTTGEQILYVKALIEALSAYEQTDYDLYLSRLISASNNLPKKLSSTLKHMVEEANQKRASGSKSSDEPDQAQDAWIWKSEDEKEESEEVHFIENAGLILVWPYLPQLYDMVGLIESRIFKDVKAAYRAVHILQYIAFKQHEAPEYDLVLNKVLCGIQTAKPVERDIRLTDHEKETADSLLKGITQNWDKLKNTSVDSFRESFLQRSGKLTKEREHWELVVEQQAYDVLLDTLPWSIATVKLPWMNEPIFVTWA